MTELCSRVGYLEHKRGRSTSRYRNTSERNISKKQKLVENESESDEDSDFEISNEETHHIPDTQQPSTSKELDNILSDGELDSEDESDDDILKELKLVFKGTEKSGPAIDKGLADVVNEGLRMVGQLNEMKKLREKFIRPLRVDNCKYQKWNHSYDLTNQTKERGGRCSCAESCVQIYARFSCDCSTVGTHK